MAETDRSAMELAALLKDLSGSVARSGKQEDLSPELMRLSDQPLLLRAFMLRSGEVASRQVSLGDFSMLVQRRAENPFSDVRSPYSPYAALESISSTSLRPERFTPSGMDRERALMDFGPGGRPALKSSSLMCCALLGGFILVAAALWT